MEEDVALDDQSRLIWSCQAQNTCGTPHLASSATFLSKKETKSLATLVLVPVAISSVQNYSISDSPHSRIAVFDGQLSVRPLHSELLIAEVPHLYLKRQSVCTSGFSQRGAYLRDSS